MKKHRDRTFRRGFSLLELTLVVMLMGILMAVVAFSLPGYLHRTRVTSTWASMRTIRQAVESYAGYNGGQYPANLAVLQQGASKFLDQQMKLQDAWKQDFIYAVNAPGSQRPYELLSKGADGVLQSGAPNSDDLSIWNEPKE